MPHDPQRDALQLLARGGQSLVEQRPARRDALSLKRPHLHADVYLHGDAAQRRPDSAQEARNAGLVPRGEERAQGGLRDCQVDREAFEVRARRQAERAQYIPIPAKLKAQLVSVRMDGRGLRELDPLRNVCPENPMQGLLCMRRRYL